jgi:hypothetical protein
VKSGRTPRGTKRRRTWGVSLRNAMGMTTQQEHDVGRESESPEERGQVCSRTIDSPMTVYIAAEILPTYNGSAVATSSIHKRRVQACIGWRCRHCSRGQVIARSRGGWPGLAVGLLNFGDKVGLRFILSAAQAKTWPASS